MRRSGDGGLLKRASLVRTQGKPPVGGLSPELDSGAAGISAEDRREILAKIDEISRGAQLSAETRSFSVQARHRGLLFPILVNLIAGIVAVGGVFGLSLLFNRREAALSDSETLVSSAEGKLLAAFKKESASQLEAKDREIIDFQNRIGALDKERGELAASIDRRVADKESELRAALRTELEREKARLLAGGLSEASAQSRLSKFEADKTAQLQRELAEYQKKAEAEKSAAEANYARVRDEYQRSIAGLAEERQRIQAESTKREAELKTRSAALESEKASAQAGLAEAQSQLAAMAEAKRKSDAAEERIVGLYASVRSALRERRYADASTGAASLRAYLDDPSLLSLPSLARRRDADVFAAESLAALAKTELDRQSLDSRRLLDQAELLESMRESSREASTALRAGRAAEAEAKYREALSALPEILAAHEYFSSKSAAEEAARGARLDASLAGLESELAAQKAASVAESLRLKEESSRFKEEASRLKDEAGRLRAEIERLGQSLATENERLAESARAAKAEGRAELEGLVAARDGRIAELERLLAEAQSASAQAGGTDLASLRAENARLAAAASSYEAILSSYAAYRASDEAQGARNASPQSLLEARARLDSFLSGPEARAAFPDLRERVARFESAFQEAGAREVLYNAMDLAEAASGIKDGAERARYFRELEARYASSPAMLAYIRSLQTWIK